jgi:hypothetical protein
LSRTIGVEAKSPNELVPLKRKRHFTFNFETVCELIGV